MPKVSRIDNGDVQPYYLKGRGNFWFTTIHQLEHTVEQIMYLVDKGENVGGVEGAKRTRSSI
jgi:hypothetical protein